jgi:hypothetical protein
MSSASPVHDPDRVFGALAHRYRRSVLTALIERDERVPLAELAEHVATGGGPGGDARTVESTDRVAVLLHHVHLPKLDGFGLVDYDGEDDRSVELTPAGHAVEPLLSHELFDEPR